ncbi:hypothetical protein AUR66_14915 [Haloferax profundi]|uniref:Uncharacterized protein n=1 Tax=Haloferax profundi TaxID=1544718 RepID=A0A0W1SLD7_9EURY|nr:hypothetical protein AUR66_14915 [Haloferax profundi]
MQVWSTILWEIRLWLAKVSLFECKIVASVRRDHEVVFSGTVGSFMVSAIAKCINSVSGCCSAVVVFDVARGGDTFRQGETNCVIACNVYFSACVPVCGILRVDIDANTTHKLSGNSTVRIGSNVLSFPCVAVFMPKPDTNI